MTDVNARIIIIGLSPRKTILSGILPSNIISIAEKASSAKLSMFLHRNDATIYKTASIILILGSSLWITEFEG